MITIGYTDEEVFDLLFELQLEIKFLMEMLNWRDLP